FVVFALAIFMVAAHTGIAAIVAQRTSLSPKTKTIVPFVVAAFLASWLAIALLVGDGANFSIPVESRQAISGLVALIAFVIAVIALFRSKSLRAINTATPSAWLIAVQTYRVAGIMFVFPFLTYGILPAGFAYPAGIGDALTGIFAPVVGFMVAQNRPHALKWAVVWNLFGTLDLIVAPAMALLFQPRVLGIYPLALVPLFLGPPLGILTHVLSLRNLAATASPRARESMIQSAAGKPFVRRNYRLLFGPFAAAILGFSALRASRCWFPAIVTCIKRSASLEKSTRRPESRSPSCCVLLRPVRYGITNPLKFT